MPAWLIVLAALFGAPAVLLATGIAAVFWVGGLAGGPQESRAPHIIAGWMALAWVMASVFGAFGLGPLWQSWQGGDVTLDGAGPRFMAWLEVVGGGGLLAMAMSRLMPKARSPQDRLSPLEHMLRGLLFALGIAPWAALAGWLAWPLVMWPVRGHFEWPDAATGWTHTAEAGAVVFLAMLVEDAVRARRRR